LSANVTTTPRRARTPEQKEFRRIQILEAAEKYFQDVGYEAFSMANLAKYAGVVKGTLYLYFTTREEVLITLYNQSLIRWGDEFLRQLRPNMSDGAFASSLYTTAMDDGSFVPLLIRLEHVIEHNVAIDSLIESKRIFIVQVDRLAEVAAPALKLSRAQASEVVRTMGVLLIGATRSDQGPSLEGETIPSDVQELIEQFSSQTLFVKNACRIIAGVRAEGTAE
jgi:AcrR family transcriptional regulator